MEEKTNRVVALENLSNSERLINVISNFVNNCKTKFGVQFLKTEAELYFEIILNPGLSVKELMHRTNLSYRGFYNSIDLLLKSGLISMVIDNKDKRVRRIYGIIPEELLN